ncbi:hypothetical protein EIN_047490 [Entamoeba invadens IP1]|uniref:TLDc domain-containing protein n=2 Tax=Entamoeba invadens TaxID=33085 RepID=A0A0A1UDN8_ENTIV|nr:hypothetical protein EIN_047490 [Entamoeba invadens IP1]ELP94456.1 hypothetical protein EIN_047490 [Entamoeba invadens IP1]BAN41373.1 hypothetical protein [Entamoeba invadens]|eukprot:XP_004261227.1 hypothetical protein EIN_047490 [Entamoeba invadens IP1]
MEETIFEVLKKHSKMLQQNALKIIDPTKCDPHDALLLETISLLTSVVDYLKMKQQDSIDLTHKIEKLETIEEVEKHEHMKQPVEESLSMGSIGTYYNTLQEWTGMSEARVVFEGNNLTPKLFWSLTKKLKNMMIVVETVDGYMFGSYHTVLPPTQDVWVNDDKQHFVFTLNNPTNYPPTRFAPLPTNGDLLFVYGDNDTENVVWVNYCFWICMDNVVFLWHHFSEKYEDTSKLGGDLFVGVKDWDFPNEIKKVVVLEWLQ